MTTITADYFNSAALASQSYSVHEQAPLAREPKWMATKAASPLQARAISALGKLAQECGKAGWDGLAAEAISIHTIVRAADFLCSLPQWMCAPDLVPEADGNLAIEWYFGPHRSFSVSINSEGPVHYAGLFGGEEEIHGVAPFVGQIPQSIVQLLARLVREASARRAA